MQSKHFIYALYYLPGLGRHILRCVQVRHNSPGEYGSLGLQAEEVKMCTLKVCVKDKKEDQCHFTLASERGGWRMINLCWNIFSAHFILSLEFLSRNGRVSYSGWPMRRSLSA